MVIVRGSETPVTFKLDGDTLFALGIAFSLMPMAQVIAARVLPRSTPRKYYYTFLWHCYDALTHLILEGSFLYHSFSSYTELPLPTSDWPHPASRRSDVIPSLWNRSDRKYGVQYSSAPMARLWQEYAKADRRWGLSDLNIISIEILTVGLACPCAAYICYLLAKSLNLPNGVQKAQVLSKMWFWAVILATGELYGGFMTFCPEWLSDNTNLAGDDPVFLWLHLVFFNTLWVFIPLWIIWIAYGEISTAFAGTARTMPPTKKIR